MRVSGFEIETSSMKEFDDALKFWRISKQFLWSGRNFFFSNDLKITILPNTNKNMYGNVMTDQQKKSK